MATRTFASETAPKVDATDQRSEVKSYLDPDVSARIKEQTLKVWERVSESKNLTQAGLANALQISQSGINKLLNNKAGHPWTPRYLKAISTYLGINPMQLINPIDRDNLRGFFEGWSGKNEPSASRLEECLSALSRFYAEQGVNPPVSKLRTLAGKLAARLKELEEQEPSNEQMQRAIRILILEEAAGSR
jgi:transcriptional regulator with XRE-family HTH domain